jgi:hypothetical protein
MYTNDVKIVPSVIVVISNSNAHLVAMALHTSLLRDVRKSAVPVVAIQPVKEARIRLLQGWQRRTVYAIEVRPSIVIEVDYTQSAEHGLDLVLAATGVVSQNKIQATPGSGILKLDRASGGCCGKRTRAR